ncbi:NB-ARC domain-containing protein, partial [Actinoplanes digitatis]
MPALADGFQPRTVGHDLDAVVGARQIAVLTQVLSGLGGVGKTQLAAGHAHHAWATGEVDLLVWVTAANRPAIIAGYAQAAGDVTGVDDPDPDLAAARLLAWLATTSRRWLIVLDDLQTPADLARLWPPSTSTGRTLVTTRRRDNALTGTHRQVVDVGLYTPDEAARYLADKLHHDPRKLQEAAELAADLGHLPLALAQAAAYLLDRGLTCATYRTRLANHRKKLAELFPEAHALPDDHQATVDVTWSLSITAADHLTPTGLARPVLELAAMLDPNGIPTTLFATAAALAYLARRRTQIHTPEERGGNDEVEADDAGDALRNLHRLSLITLDPNAGTLRIHALVQRAIRDQRTRAQRSTAAHIAADALLAIWPGIERDPTISQTLRANTAALRQHSGDSLISPNTHPIVFRAGSSLGHTGQVRAAVTAFEQLLDDLLRVLGPDHPNTLVTHGYLAHSRGAAGDPAGAATAFEQLLDDLLRVLGPDH